MIRQSKFSAPRQRKMMAGGLVDRPYGLGNLPWPRKPEYSFAEGGVTPPASSIFSDDIPSSRPGYRTRIFDNPNALPYQGYSAPVTRQEYENQTGAFKVSSLDFPLNQARYAFDTNPNVTAVNLGQERSNVEGAVNPSYPLTRRYEEYREPNIMPTHPGPLPVKQVAYPSFATTNKTPRQDNWMSTNFTSFDHPEFDKALKGMGKKGQSPALAQYAKGGWIQGAVNPKHKGFCTPMTKSTCTPRRKAFAMTMKKHHGFHKKAVGGRMTKYSKPSC